MTLPKAISDAIDEHEERVRADGSGRCSVESRAALERAIAEAIACAGDEKIAAWRKAAAEGVRLERITPVDAPTEAEIESWEQRARDLLKSSGLRVRATMIREDGTPTGEELDSPPLAYVLMLREAVALMRRAAAAKPVVEPWPNEHGTHDVKLHYDGSRSVEGVTFTLTDRKTGVVTRYVPEAAAATPASSALERLRERVDRAAAVENIELGELCAFDRVLDWIDEEREREAGHG